MDLKPGEKPGPYEILSRIGAGRHVRTGDAPGIVPGMAGSLINTELPDAVAEPIHRLLNWRSPKQEPTPATIHLIKVRQHPMLTHPASF